MSEASHESGCAELSLQAQLSRRGFLFGASATLVWLGLPGCGEEGSVPAQVAEYPRQAIGRLSDLEVGRPVSFSYPFEHPSATNTLLKLGRPAGGGVGPDQDVVAFNSFCTHQGGPLAGLFRADPGVAGPCPLHWTTFDLTRHGMVVSGHATMGLPQILLEVEKNEIYATGVMGLVFGYSDNTHLLARG